MLLIFTLDKQPILFIKSNAAIISCMGTVLCVCVCVCVVQFKKSLLTPRLGSYSLVLSLRGFIAFPFAF